MIGIQARSNSTRLPGKIYEIIGNKQLLEHVYDICKSAVKDSSSQKVVIVHPLGDTELIKWCDEKGYEHVGGSEEDVVARYLEAAKFFNADKIVRVTADCWNIPVEMIIDCIKELQNSDYVSNVIYRSYPEGFDVQGCSINALEWVFINQKTAREHLFCELDENQMVRSHFKADGFRVSCLVNAENVIFQHNSIDTAQDLEKARRIYAARQSVAKQI